MVDFEENGLLIQASHPVKLILKISMYNISHAKLFSVIELNCYTILPDFSIQGKGKFS
jgi:hypothetical protein